MKRPELGRIELSAFDAGRIKKIEDEIRAMRVQLTEMMKIIERLESRVWEGL